MSLPDLDDDDSQRIANAAARSTPVDPPTELRRLGVWMEAHDRQDARRWRWAVWATGTAFFLGISVLGVAWSANANAAADRARLEDIAQRCERIESQLDRLMERDR